MLWPMPDEALQTLSQVARTVNRSTRTLMRWIDSGQLKEAQKLPGPNGAYLFNQAGVDRAAELAKAHGTSGEVS